MPEHPGRHPNAGNGEQQKNDAGDVRHYSGGASWNLYVRDRMMFVESVSTAIKRKRNSAFSI